MQFDECSSAITIFQFILTCSSWVRECVLLVLLLQEKKFKEFHRCSLCREVHRFLEVYVCWGEGAWLYRRVARQLILPTWIACNRRQSSSHKQCSIICKRKLPNTIFPILFLLSSVFPPPFLCCAFLRNCSGLI